MNKPTRQPPQHDSDYDGAWKEALRNHFSHFIAKYFPIEHAAIDWSIEPQWYDKELSQVLGQSGRRNATVDILVKVRLHTGAEQWILLHLEIQTAKEEEFAARIGLYNSGLHWIFKNRVMTLVVLADLNRDWQPREDVFQIGGFESRLTFPTCKLIDKLDKNWQHDHSLPVVLARAQIEALRTASDAEARYQAKWSLVRSLYDLGYNAEQVRELFRLVNWMMHLRSDLEELLDRELAVFEEERKMPFVTSIERVASARLLVAQLREICGPIPDESEKRVRYLPYEQLEQLGIDLLQFKSLADLANWLDQNAPRVDDISPENSHDG